MKNIYFSLFMVFVSYTYAQVDYEKKFISTYIDFATLDYQSEQYYYDEEGGEREIQFFPEESHYILVVDGSTPETILWEYLGDEDSLIIYEDQDGDRIVFNDAEEQIWFYTNYNDETEFYEKLMILSNIDVVQKNRDGDKSPGGYIPQTMRK